MTMISHYRTRHHAIAEALANHAREGGDVGDLLAAACRTAAASLDGHPDEWIDVPLSGIDALLNGRPGSWEADLVRGLAGGWEYETRAQDGPQ